MTTCIFFDFQDYCHLPDGVSALAHDAPIELDDEKLQALEAFAKGNPEYQFCVLSENSAENKRLFLEAIKDQYPTLHKRLADQEEAIKAGYKATLRADLVEALNEVRDKKLGQERVNTMFESYRKDTKEEALASFMDSVTSGIHSNAKMSATHPSPWDDDTQDGLKPWHKALAIRRALRATEGHFDTVVLLSEDESKRDAFTTVAPGCAAVELIGESGAAVEKVLNVEHNDIRETDIKKSDRDQFEEDAYARVLGVQDYLISSRWKYEKDADARVLSFQEYLASPRRKAEEDAINQQKIDKFIKKYQLNGSAYDWRSLIEKMNTEKLDKIFGTFSTPEKREELDKVLNAMDNSGSKEGKKWLAKNLNKAEHPGAVMQVVVEAWRAHHDRSATNFFGGRYMKMEAHYQALERGDKAICAEIMRKIGLFKSPAKGRRGWSWRRPKSTLEVFEKAHRMYFGGARVPSSVDPKANRKRCRWFGRRK